MHESQAMLKTPSVSHGTILERGRIFPTAQSLGTHGNAIQLKTCERTPQVFFCMGGKVEDNRAWELNLLPFRSYVRIIL